MTYDTTNLIQSFAFPRHNQVVFPLLPPLSPPSLSSTRVWTISVKKGGEGITPHHPGAFALLADIWLVCFVYDKNLGR